MLRLVALLALCCALPLPLPAAGRQATPGPKTVPEALFVQGFASATLGPAGADGVRKLAVEGTPGRLAWFADHPDRRVGSVRLGEWLEVLAAAGDDPLNAALAAEPRGGGSVEVVVVELLAGEAVPGGGGVTYAVRDLADLGEFGRDLGAAPSGDLGVGRAFGPGHLFVDSLQCFGCPMNAPNP